MSCTHRYLQLVSTTLERWMPAPEPFITSAGVRCSGCGKEFTVDSPGGKIGDVDVRINGTEVTIQIGDRPKLHWRHP